jgi:hypothetical protein
VSGLGEYPVTEIADVDPIFVRQMMLGAMAIRYLRAVPGLELDTAYQAARATWDTDWPDDPAPRTFEASVEVVDDDLAYWGEE